MSSDHKISEEIALLKDILVTKFGPKQIILFGSFAYGQPDVDSDIDVCVIMDFHGQRKIEVLRAMRRELAKSISSPLDILLYYEHEFEERAKLMGSLEYKILTQGVKIYEQSRVVARVV